MRVSPITCYRPNFSAASDFASLPYDVFDEDEARAYVESHPNSFLAIDRAETAFEPGHDPYADDVYEKAGQLIRSKGYDGTLLKDQTPCYYLYRLEKDGHAQLGVVAACSVAEYEDGTIRRHENTHPEKTADRVKHILATGAQTGPVLLAYPDDMVVDVIVGAARTADPLYDFVDENGVRQTIWRVARDVTVEAIEFAFSKVPCAYIADGHHRASAAAEVCHLQHEQAADDTKELASDSFLAVLFPASSLKLLPYNRVVADTCGLTPEQLTSAIASAGFEVKGPIDSAIWPEEPRSFGLYVGEKWYSLRYTGPVADTSVDPAAALDVSILQDRVLAPILGIADPRTDQRISFVGGSEGASGLERRAKDSGVAFSLYPTSVDDLMRVSDAGRLMPPKSTWFDPKLLSGFFIRRV